MMKVTYPAKPPRSKRKALAREGADAFAAALTTSDCPYKQNTLEWDHWLHGWWGAYYKQRDALLADGKLCGSCAKPIDNLTTGVYVIGKHGTTKTVCGDCKTDLVRWDDYQVMAQAKSITQEAE